MMSLASGGAEEPEPDSTKVLWVNLAEAEGRLEDRQAARDLLIAEIKKHEYRGYFLKCHIDDAAAAVVRAETKVVADKMVADIAAKVRDLAFARANLEWLERHKAFGELAHETPSHVSSALRPMSDQVCRLQDAGLAASP